MTVDFQGGHGIMAIDPDAIYRAHSLGDGVNTGLGATVTGSDLTVTIGTGSAFVNGTFRNFGSTTAVDFTGDPDPSLPRKALIVINSAGAIVKRLGTPVVAAPAGNRERDTYDPDAPNFTAGDCILHEVWLDATDTAIVAADVSDRRIDAVSAMVLTDTGKLQWRDVGLGRTTADRLDLDTGDDLNLVLGDYMIAGVSVINSSRDLIGLNQVAQNLDPNAGNSFDLGDATLTWRDLFLAGALRFGSTVVLTGASNVLSLASGDSLNLISGQYRSPLTGSTGGILLGADAQWFRGALDRMDLASGDTLRLVAGIFQLGADLQVSRGAANRLDFAASDFMRFVGQTVDPTTPPDGSLWYRTDTDRYGARAAGVSETLAYQSDLGAVSGTKDLWQAVELADLTIGSVVFSDVSGTRPFWKGIAFPAGSNGAVEWRFIIPRDWDGTSNFQVKLYWLRAGTGTGTNVVWQANFVAIAAGENVDTPSFTNISTTTRAVAGVDILEVFDMGGMTSAQVAVDDIINFEIFRDGDDAADDFSLGVLVLGVKIEYTAG